MINYRKVSVEVYVEAITCGGCGREEIPTIVTAQEDYHPRPGLPARALVANGTRSDGWAYGMDVGMADDGRSVRLCPDCCAIAARAVREALAKL